MKLTIGIAAFCVVLVLAGAAGLVLLTDPKALGDQMVSRLEALTQRKVTLSTPPSIAWSLSPELEVQNLAVKAAATENDAISIGQVRAQLDLKEVVQGILNFDQLEVRDVVVNWNEDTRRLVRHLRTLSSASASGTELRLEGASITDVIVKLDDTGPVEQAHLKSAEYSRGRPTAIIAEIRVKGRDLSINGKVAPKPEKLQLDLQVVTNKTSATLSGSVVTLDPLSGVDLVVSASLNEDRVKGSLTGNDMQLRLANAVGLAAGHPFKGELSLQDLKSSPKMTGAIWIDSFVPAQGGSEGLVLPSTPVPVDIQLTIGKVGLRNWPLEGVSGTLALDGDQREFKNLRANLANGSVKGAVKLNGDAPDYRLEARLNANGLALAELPAFAPVHDDISGRIDALIDIRGTGATPKAWARSLSGSTRLVLDNGRAKAARLELLIGGVTTLLDTFAAGRGDWVDLNCAAADFSWMDGVGNSRLIVIDSEHASVVGEGSINIPNQQLALHVTPRPKSPTLNLALPVRIEGPLGKPNFSIDRGAAAKRVGGILASALVFPPALIATFADLGVEDAGCVGAYVLDGQDSASDFLTRSANVVEGTAKAVTETGKVVGSAVGEAGKAVADTAEQASKAAAETITEATKEVEKAAESLGKTIGKIFGN